MDKKTSRFLFLEAAVILFVLLLGQIFPYPITSQADIEKRVEDTAGLFDYRTVVKADLGSSVVYVLDINGQYCEKAFDKSLLFDRYVEKPLVLLRGTAENADAQFVLKDSAQSHLYSINEKEEMVILKQSQNDGVTLAYTIFGGTIILLGLVFGTGKNKGKRA